MRIALDAMGGDNAPSVTIEGAIEATKQGVDVILVGREPDIKNQLAKHSNAPHFEIVHSPDVIEMHEHPANAVRQKRDSSINVAMRLLKEGRAQALFSAGNSGAVMASALFTIGRIQNVHRPAIGGVLPLLRSRVFLLDVGANADCDPNNLLQFAQLGGAY